MEKKNNLYISFPCINFEVYVSRTKPRQIHKTLAKIFNNYSQKNWIVLELALMTSEARMRNAWGLDWRELSTHTLRKFSRDLAHWKDWLRRWWEDRLFRFVCISQTRRRMPFWHVECETYFTWKEWLHSLKYFPIVIVPLTVSSVAFPGGFGSDSLGIDGICWEVPFQASPFFPNKKGGIHSRLTLKRWALLHSCCWAYW